MSDTLPPFDPTPFRHALRERALDAWTAQALRSLLDALDASAAREADLARRLAESESEFMGFAIAQDGFFHAYEALADRLAAAEARIAALTAAAATS